MIDIGYLTSFLLAASIPQQDVDILICIAEQESRFKPQAININKNGTRDYGLFQINDVWLEECNTTPQKLLQPHANASCAITVYRTQGLKAWATYKHCK